MCCFDFAWIIIFIAYLNGNNPVEAIMKNSAGSGQ